MTADFALVHYHEIALKGRNRPLFVDRLVSNLRIATRDLGVRAVERLPGRLLLALEPGAAWEPLRERLAAVFGVANFARAVRAPADPPHLRQLVAAVEAMLGERRWTTFRVLAKRGDKRFPLTSPQIAAIVGGALKASRGGRVDLERAEVTVHLEVLTDSALVYLDKEPGLGGLPVGVSGTVAVLLSGGIDSPVAAYRMLKRGCRALLVHFHGYPFVDRSSIEKAQALARQLARFQYESVLHLVPFGEVQRQIVIAAPPALRVVLYRRMMLRIAEAIARRAGAAALVTGDSVGQVASQTLDNLAVVERAAALPVLRPLIGMDKEEIAAQARAIGTFAISILPDQDCCTLFVPRRPATRARPADVEAVEARLAVERLVERALEGDETLRFTFPEPAAAPPAAAGQVLLA
ncbi:MAG TPA: tRNA uracil 4-sulfurtransferase ThiI [Thermodesulfobacteriota bacterium]|nr:tRNA uracil 4-sulfurtransferase ThiI [Thermodesulfobacteriota bacterium]